MKKAMKKLGISFPLASVGAVVASLLVRGSQRDLPHESEDVNANNPCQVQDGREGPVTTNNENHEDQARLQTAEGIAISIIPPTNTKCFIRLED
ncbi:hypothetical protein A0U91_16730 (plasmid) [Acetobacter persici]|uniref:Secreted protein n=1 Tax=Acetobacter persici TaxID=1076596 RepID=A0A1U9LK31_9PROT|nr:hypothetical protein A0U91_16730 [Acetobacter persici]